MRRIVIAIDNYNELTHLHVRLKKIGFDIESVQNQRNFERTLLVFNPLLIIASTMGVKIDGFKIASETLKNSGFPKIILLKSKKKSYKKGAFELPEIDRVLESPIKMKELIMALADLLNLDASLLISKYEKIFDSIDKEISYDALVEGSNEQKEETKASLKFDTTTDVEARRNRYQKFIEGQKNAETPKENKFSAQRVTDYVKKIRAEERTDELVNLDQERIEFVKALFSQAK